MAIAVALMPLTSRASAQVRSFKLEWSAPEECPDERRVRRRVDELVASGPPSPQPVRLAARGAITRRESGFRLELFTERNGERGQRVLEGPACAPLADAAALILALLQRAPANPSSAEPTTTTPNAPAPDATAAAPINEHSEEPASKPAATAPTANPPPTQHTAPKPPDPKLAPNAPPPVATPGTKGAWSGAVIAGIGVNGAVLPRPGLGLVAGGSLGLGHARAELIGAAWGEQHESANDSAFSSSFKLLSLSAALCYAVELSALELGPCAGIALSQIHAHGRGPALLAKEPTIRWASALIAGRLGWRFSRYLGLDLRADVLWSPVVARFVVDGVGPIYGPSTLSVEAWLGPSLHF